MLNIAVFMRMYLMGMTMCLLLTYCQIKWLKSPSIGYGVSLSIVSLTGALTHYYFIFFCFFSWLFCLLYMLKEKYSWKNVLVYFLWPCLAGGLMLAVWPVVINHVLYRSGVGGESIWSFSHFGAQLSYYYDRLNQNLFGYALPVLAAVLLTIFIFIRKKADIPDTDDAHFRLSLVLATFLLPTLLYFLLVAKISTFYLDERYMALIYPLFLLSVLLLLWRLASIKKSVLLRGLAVASCVAFTASAWVSCNWFYSFRSWNAPIHDINNSGLSDAIVVLKDDEVWKVWTLYPKHQQMDSVTYVPANQLEDARDVLEDKLDHCYLAISRSLDAADILSALYESPPEVDELHPGEKGYFADYLVMQP